MNNKKKQNQRRLFSDTDWLQRFSLPSVIFFVGLILSLAIYRQMDINFKEKVYNQFNREMQRHGQEIEHGIKLYTEATYHVRAAFLASETLSPELFRLISEFELERKSGLLSLQWLPKITPDERERFEYELSTYKGERAFISWKNPEGRMIPALGSEYYFPIRLLEPYEANKVALGLDSPRVMSPSSYEGVVNAIYNNALSVSEPVDLVQTDQDVLGVVIHLPVYREHSLTEQNYRIESTLGLVGAVLQLNTMFEQVIEQNTKPAGLNLVFEDITFSGTPKFLHRHESRISTLSDADAPLSGEVTFNIANRVWRMTAFSANSDAYPSWSVTNVFTALVTFLISLSLAVFQYIREIKESEKQELLEDILERENKYSILVDTIPGVVYSCKPDSSRMMTFVSNEVFQLTGHPPESFLSKFVSWSDLVFEEDKQKVRNTVIDSLSSGDSYAIQYRIVNKDGTIRWIYDCGQALYNDLQVPHIVHGTITDITEKVITDKQFKGLLESTPDIVVIIDDKGDITFVNRQFEHALGYSQDEILGKKIEVLIPEKFRNRHPNLREQYNKSPSIRSMYESGELAILTKDQREIPVEVSLSPIDTNTGLLVCAAIRDITNRKKMEKALIDAKEKAETATEAKSAFLANMSHEIRTPMNAIIGMSYLALDTELDNRQKEYVNTIYKSANLLLGIINDILDISKIEAGKLALESIDFSLEDVFQNIANIISGRAEEKGIEIVFDIAPEVPDLLKGDPLRLGQVLVNLVNNAIKFTEEGEISIQVKLNERTDNDVNVSFIVQDTGIGIPEDKMDTLFSSFEQVDSSTTRKYGGSGLGLSICKHLVDMMEGVIWCESKLHKGSTFSFKVTLPVVETATTSDQSSIIGFKKILIIDDNAHVLQVLSEISNQFGLLVDTCSDTTNALDQITSSDRNSPYDLVLIDWDMPNLSGSGLIRLIQSNQEIISQPKIMLMAPHNPSHLMESCNDLTIDYFISKPITPSSLFDAFMDIKRPNNIQINSSNHKDNLSENTMAKLVGAKLLLVEDHDVNRIVAVELLSKAGIETVTAVNGAIALDKLAKESFDGVLMDCQMPVMDGYEATQRIRKMPQYKELPILAMTANALKADIQKALDCGMNAHIAKPIDINAMFQTLAEWITPAANLDSETGDSERKRHSHEASLLTEQSNERVDNQLLNRDVVTSFSGSEKSVILQILEAYVSKQDEDKSQLRLAVENEDRAQVKDISHRIKGASSYLGAEKVTNKAKMIEQASGSDSFELLHTEAEELILLLEVLEDEVNEWLNELTK